MKRFYTSKKHVMVCEDNKWTYYSVREGAINKLADKVLITVDKSPEYRMYFTNYQGYLKFVVGKEPFYASENWYIEYKQLEKISYEQYAKEVKK